MPWFQPIVSVESQAVAAYEALGRHEVGGRVESLGPFFHDAMAEPALSDLRRDVDRHLRRAALEAFAAQATPGQRLFVNVSPRLMVEHLARQSDELPWTLQMIEAAGVDPRRVVIELTEEAVGAETPTLRRLVEEYRRHGCQIAVDDVGAEASNLDRIGFFEPDIIKIDAMLLRRSLAERSFRQVLAGLQTIADGLGASLLFEGVETDNDIDQALRFGARYLQGWVFAPAAPTLAAPDQFQARLRGRLEVFGEARRTEIQARDHRLGEVVAQLSAHLPGVIGVETLAPWTGLACRVYLTDRRGFQTSPDYVAWDGGWVAVPEARGRCRTARPYFAASGAPSQGGQRIWSVTDPYFDPEDRRLMRTYGRQVDAGALLFVDVPEVFVDGPEAFVDGPRPLGRPAGD